MVILHGLIKMFKLELYLIIVLVLLLLPRFTLMLGFFVAEFYTQARGKGR
jgi:hypothetical protein